MIAEGSIRRTIKREASCEPACRQCGQSEGLLVRMRESARVHIADHPPIGPLQQRSGTYRVWQCHRCGRTVLDSQLTG